MTRTVFMRGLVGLEVVDDGYCGVSSTRPARRSSLEIGVKGGSSLNRPC